MCRSSSSASPWHWRKLIGRSFLSTTILPIPHRPSPKSWAKLDGRVRCIRRVGRRGLAGACIEGALSSQARYVAVMDADLQHDERLLPRMLELLDQNQADLVIASRYMAGGATTGLSSSRRSISRVATRWAQKLMGITVQDPMSGFFMVRRDLLDAIAPQLSNEGFKILFDILVASGRGKLEIVELPYAFLPRLHGASKFDARNAIEFFALVMSKLSRKKVPPQFFSFLLVGGGGGWSSACLSWGRPVGRPRISRRRDCCDASGDDEQFLSEQRAHLPRPPRDREASSPRTT